MEQRDGGGVHQQSKIDQFETLERPGTRPAARWLASVPVLREILQGSTSIWGSYRFPSLNLPSADQTSVPGGKPVGEGVLSVFQLGCSEMRWAREGGKGAPRARERKRTRLYARQQHTGGRETLLNEPPLGVKPER